MAFVHASRFLLSVAVSILLLLGMPRDAEATQIALVDRDVGHALLFKHRGNCYALLPSHVAERDSFSLQMPLQNLIGAGTVFLRDAQSDLALAFVEGDVIQRCLDDWSSFQTDLTTLLDNQKSGEIFRLSPEGIQDRTAGDVFVVTPDIVAVRTSDDLALGEIQKGSSGSVLEIAGTVIGIAQRAPSGSEAVFYRMDEIARRLGSDLSQAHLNHDGQQSGFRVTGWSGKTASSEPDEAGQGLLERAFVTTWDGKPQQIEITLHPTEPIALNSIILGSQVGDRTSQTPPKTISIQVDAGPPDAPFWRSVGVRDMTPRGDLKIDIGGVFVRRVRLTMNSVWFADRPLVRLDRLDVE
ncbi:hypothetical protein [Cognatishimia sp. MH4019]|uniref:hypothetical protein n=1 Tax=Cognatishimia sp. MH4019 TaxID=2854030 RepID=UPI001CD5EBC6|nr:hypothetical protein [Cognatishimia sp. MH4019]